MSELLKCTGLTKNYNGVLALNKIDLTLESGKIYGLLGPNGSGKTTLIKLINGLLTPTLGSVTVLGKEPGVESKKIISYLPDNSYLNSWMRVEQIVEQFCDFYEDFRADAAYKMLEGLGIDRTAKLKNAIKMDAMSACYRLEAEADDQVSALLERYRAEMEAVGGDASEIDALWSVYSSEKASVKAYYLNLVKLKEEKQT